MSPAMAELVEALEVERCRPVPPPREAYPDGPTARAMRQAAVAEAAMGDGEEARGA